MTEKEIVKALRSSGSEEFFAAANLIEHLAIGNEKMREKINELQKKLWKKTWTPENEKKPGEGQCVALLAGGRICRAFYVTDGVWLVPNATHTKAEVLRSTDFLCALWAELPSVPEEDDEWND